MVNDRLEAIVRLRVRGPSGIEVELDAIIDSGFSSLLTLPGATVAALGLTSQSVGKAVLADGSVRRFDLCAAEVNWDGVWIPILISAVGDETLLGMRLLEGFELRVAVKLGGDVEIAPLP